MSGFERSTLRLSVIGLAVTILTGIFIALQWREMHSGSVDTHTLAEAAKATAESAKRQADNTASQLLVAESQAKATQDQVDAIKRQMGVSERAQVKIIPDLDANIAFGANKELRIPIKLSNIGKTAATKIHIKSVVSILFVGEEPDFSYPSERTVHTITGNLYPGEPPYLLPIVMLEGKNKPHMVTQSEYESFIHGVKYEVTYGQVTYRDIFGVNHWSKFCGYGPGSFASLHGKCAEYNNTDNH